MTTKRISVNIDQSTVAYFDAAIDSYFDELWDAVDVEETPSLWVLSITMRVTASDDSTSKTFTFTASMSDTSQALCIAMVGAWTTGISAVVTASDFDAITAINGSVTLVVTY